MKITYSRDKTEGNQGKSEIQRTKGLLGVSSLWRPWKTLDGKWHHFHEWSLLRGWWGYLLVTRLPLSEELQCFLTCFSFEEREINFPSPWCLHPVPRFLAAVLFRQSVHIVLFILAQCFCLLNCLCYCSLNFLPLCSHSSVYSPEVETWSHHWTMIVLSKNHCKLGTVISEKRIPWTQQQKHQHLFVQMHCGNESSTEKSTKS